MRTRDCSAKHPRNHTSSSRHMLVAAGKSDHTAPCTSRTYYSLSREYTPYYSLERVRVVL